MTLQEARDNIGALVMYEPYPFCPISLREFGYITSVNDTYVFVRYGNDTHSKATRPENLRF